jgi:uncharacterized protein
MGNMLSIEVGEALKESVLCWLATVDSFGFPNVSPKEIFAPYENSRLLIANIASPSSVKNIIANPAVCVSFINIFKQKGFKVKGTAKILTMGQDTYQEKHAVLFKLAGPRFPIKSIIDIQIEEEFPILAPSYILYPETSEETQIENAMKAYKLPCNNN